MKYTTANEILPKELLEQVQKYIQGQYIYIPKDRYSLFAQTESCR